MFEVLPAILEKDWESIEKKLEIVKPFAKSVHIDILDGKFAPNTTFLDPKPFIKYSKDLFLELHIMVEEPINYLKPFAEAGFKRFLGHVEKMSDQEEFVAQGQLLGEVGLAVDGPTSLDEIKVPLDDLDAILIMTIKAGFSGQVFNHEYVRKIKQIRNEILKPFDLAQGGQVQNDKVKIEVDGGINDQTIELARTAGANRFIASSFIFGHQDPQFRYQSLKNLLK